MGRFYFHLFNDHNVWDCEGVELADEAEALRYGTRAIREMAAESIRDGRLVLGHRIIVCTETNRSIRTFQVGDVIEIES